MDKKLILVTNKKGLRVFFSPTRILITSSSSLSKHVEVLTKIGLRPKHQISIKDHEDVLGIILIYKINDVEFDEL